MRTFIFISALLIFSTQCFDLFSYTPNSNFYLGNQTATAMKIASDQSMIVVGFQNGSVKSFSLFGSSLNNFPGHNSSILDVKWIPNVGPITLDNAGKVILFKSNGSQVFTMALNSSSMKSMTVTSNNNVTNYVGFNFGTYVQEYMINNTSMTFVKNYNAASGTTFTQFYYSSGYQFLFVGTNTSTVRYFNCSTGTLLNSSYSLSNSSTVKTFSTYGSNYVLMTSNSQFYSFTTTMNFTYIGNATATSSTMVACPSSNYIIAGESFNSYLDVYSGSFREQKLTYLRNIAKSIDCSSGYLVSVDTSNYLAISPYFVISVPLAKWIIGVIAGGAALVVIVAIVVIIICVRRKRRTLMTGMNETNFGKELMSPGDTYRHQEPYIANTYQQRF